MRFIVSSLIALGLTGFASANTMTTFETEITYDRDLVSVPAGAEIVFNKIVTLARRECRADSVASFGYRFKSYDKVCVSNFVEQAVDKIDVATLHNALADSKYAK